MTDISKRDSAEVNTPLLYNTNTLRSDSRAPSLGDGDGAAVAESDDGSVSVDAALDRIGTRMFHFRMLFVCGIVNAADASEVKRCIDTRVHGRGYILLHCCVAWHGAASPGPLCVRTRARAQRAGGTAHVERQGGGRTGKRRIWARCLAHVPQRPCSCWEIVAWCLINPPLCVCLLHLLICVHSLRSSWP